MLLHHCAFLFPLPEVQELLSLQGKVILKWLRYKHWEKNGKVPFIVKILNAADDSGEVEVLGTHFNIMAYGDEGAVKTTLLEGSVKVKEP